MQDLASLDAPIVALSERQQYLHEYFPNDVLGDKILVLLALLDELGHVTILTVLHDDVDLLLLPQVYAFDILDDVRVIQLAEAVDLAHDLAALFFR